MTALPIVELLVALAVEGAVGYLGDVKAFVEIVPPMPFLGYSYVKFAVVLALIG